MFLITFEVQEASYMSSFAEPNEINQWKPDDINILFSLFNHFEQSIFFLVLLMTKYRQIFRPHTFISLDGS